MRYKWSGKRFEWFKSTIDMWGTIAPPDTNRFASPADVYLDIGSPGRCVRNLYVQNLLDCTGAAYNLSGTASAGATSFSGLLDTAGIYTSGQLTRWDGSFWQPYNEILSHPGLSGLVDVQTTPWVSGNIVGWNGTQYVPTTPGSASPQSNVSGHFISQFSATDTVQFVHSLGSYPQVTVLDSIFCEQDVQVCHDDTDTTTLTFNGTISGWFIADIGLAGLAGADGLTGADGAPGATTLTGLTDTTLGTLISGHFLNYNGTAWVNASYFLQPSGFQVPSGNYATVEQGHNLWAASGNLQTSGDYTTKTEVQANYLRLDGTNDPVTGDITFNDDIAIRFGTGNDTAISSDGTDLILDSAVGVVNVPFVDLQRGSVSVVTEDRTVTAGAGMTGGGDLSSNKTLNVIAAANGGLTVNADSVEVDWTNLSVSPEIINTADRIAVYDNSTTSMIYHSVGSFDTFFALSGNLAPSGDYATVSQGHNLWQTSGANLEAAGDVSRVSTLASGHIIGWNGTGWVNSSAPAGGGGSPHNIISATHSDAAGTPISGHVLSYDGTNWRPDWRATSGFMVPSGNYATVSQGHNLWMASGIFEASGITATVMANHVALSDPHTQYLTEAIAATTYQLSGANLEAAGDVSRISTLVSGHIIGWNGTGWVNTTAPAGGGGAPHNIISATHSDSAGTAASGHVLSYDGINWRPDWRATSGYQVPSGDYATVSQGHIQWQTSGANLEAAGDVNRVSPLVSGHLISFNGTSWVNATAAAGGGTHTIISATHSDTTGTAASGHVLGYDGTNWRPATAGGGGSSVITTAKTIQTRTVLFSSGLTAAGSIDITGIDQTYDHLELFVRARSDAAVTGDGINMQFNSDTTAGNYEWAHLVGGSTTPLQVAFADSYGLGAIAGTTAQASSFSPIWVKIPHYTAADKTKHSQITSVDSRQAGYLDASVKSQHWQSTAPITSIKLITDNDPTDLFLSGTTVELIGIKEESVVTSVTGGGSALTITSSGQVQTRVLIQRHELIAASGTFHFNNIVQTYDHLEYKIRGRSTGGTTNVGVNIRFNADGTDENYDVATHYHTGQEDDATAHIVVSNEDTRRSATINGDGNTATLFSTVEGKIFWYADSTRQKQWKFESTWKQDVSTAAFYRMTETGHWASTAPITDVEFDDATATFASGTIIELYGIKKQWVVNGTLGDATIVNGLIVP